MRHCFVLGIGLALAMLSAGCCCFPCCGSGYGGYGGYGGCGPAGCPAPVGIPAGAYYAPACNGSCAY